MQNQISSFGRFWVKEPSHSEAVSDENCCLCRSTCRCTSAQESRPTRELSSSPLCQQVPSGPCACCSLRGPRCTLQHYPGRRGFFAYRKQWPPRTRGDKPACWWSSQVSDISGQSTCGTPGPVLYRRRGPSPEVNELVRFPP